MSDAALTLTENEVKRLSRSAEDILQRLKHQREMLRQKGMDIPPGSLQSMDGVRVELEAVCNRVVEQHNEVERLRILVKTTGMINSSLKLDDTLGAIMDVVIQLTNAQRGYILLRDEVTNQMEVRAHRGLDEAGEPHTFSNTIVQQVLKSGEPLVTTDAKTDDRFSNQQSIVGLNLRSILCVPLIIKGVIQGAVYADSRIHDALFGTKELQLLVAVANQSALAIENARLFERARATLQEVTEVKILLDSILASIASGVITTDPDNQITTFNAGAEAILGMVSQQTLGESIETVIPMIYQEIAGILPMIRTQDETVTLDTETQLRGDVRNLNLKLSPFKDGNQITQGVALVVDDQTELKKRDAMLDAVRRYLPPAMVDNIRDIENIGLGGERRTITVLFVEVLPFTNFQSHFHAEQLMELLNVYLTAGTEAIHRRAGLVDKYMGSEIMALFNTQLNPSEHHSWDAVHAAIEMMYDFQDLYHQHLHGLPQMPYSRIGIHTGIATLGNVGGSQRREFTALGDTVNLAKRLEENASQGQLLISEATHEACLAHSRDFMDFEVISRGNLQVKGRTQETRVFEIKPKT